MDKKEILKDKEFKCSECGATSGKYIEYIKKIEEKSNKHRTFLLCYCHNCNNFLELEFAKLKEKNGTLKNILLIRPFK